MPISYHAFFVFNDFFKKFFNFAQEVLCFCLIFKEVSIFCKILEKFSFFAREVSKVRNNLNKNIELFSMLTLYRHIFKDLQSIYNYKNVVFPLLFTFYHIPLKFNDFFRKKNNNVLTRYKQSAIIKTVKGGHLDKRKGWKHEKRKQKKRIKRKY